MASKPKQVHTKIDVPEEKPSADDVEYNVLSCDLIDDPEQPIRTDLTPASVESLVLSMKQVGIIQPLVVKPVNGRYEVIAGHRRLYAAGLAKIALVPCFIRKANMEETEMLKIHENLYREDIKPADEAKHYDYLVSKQKMTPTQIAKLISKSASYVTDRLAILSYSPVLRDAMDKGEVSFSVAREFSRFTDEKQLRSAVFYSKRAGMTYEMAKKWVNDWKYSQNNPNDQNMPSSDGSEGVEPIEHSVQCGYCRKGVRMVEAEVVYVHKDCLLQLNAVEIKDEPTGASPLPSL